MRKGQNKAKLYIVPDRLTLISGEGQIADKQFLFKEKTNKHRTH